MNNDNEHNQNPRDPDQNDYARQAQAAADRAKAAAQDALGASRGLLANPVAGIGQAHASLGRERVLGVGIIFALVAAIGLALASGLLVRAILGGLASGYGAGFGFQFGAFIQSTIVNLVAILAAGAAVFMLAKPMGGQASAPSGVFVAATAFLPIGIASLLAAIVAGILPNKLGMFIASLLMIFGACYLILVLNAGLRQVVGLDERRAALATPTVLAVSAVVSTLLGSVFN